MIWDAIIPPHPHDLDLDLKIEIWNRGNRGNLDLPKSSAAASRDPRQELAFRQVQRSVSRARDDAPPEDLIAWCATRS